jgi:hypothetical protein
MPTTSAAVRASEWGIEQGTKLVFPKIWLMPVILSGHPLRQTPPYLLEIRTVLGRIWKSSPKCGFEKSRKVAILRVDVRGRLFWDRETFSPR